MTFCMTLSNCSEGVSWDWTFLVLTAMLNFQFCNSLGYCTLNYRMLMNGAILLVLSACSIELVHRFFDAVFDDGFGGLVCSVDRGFDGG